MFHTLHLLFTAGFRIFFDNLKFMRKYAKHPEKASFEKKYSLVKSQFEYILKSYGAEIVLLNKENLPSSGVSLYISNHTHTYDPLTMLSILDNECSFLSKKENENKLFIGKTLKCLEAEFIDRDDLRQSLKCLMRIENDLKNGIKSWIIYPEGTRNTENRMEMLDFHDGSFRCAIRAGVPIVPIVEYGVFNVIDRKPKCKKYPVVMKVLKPLNPSDYEGKSTAEVAHIIRDEMQKALTEEVVPLYNEFVDKYKK